MSKARYESDAAFAQNVDRNVSELKSGVRPTVHADPEVLVYAQVLVDAEKQSQIRSRSSASRVVGREEAWRSSPY